MKKFKKVIPALCMLLVSAVMLGTSTFAWFSMNNTVTATNMQVTAQTNSKFLVVSNTKSLANVTTTTLDITNKTGGVDDAHTKAYPAAICTTADNPKAGVAVGDWYTANSTSYTQSTGGLTNITKIEDENLDQYRITYTFYIGLAAGSDAVTDTTLTFTPTTDLTNSVAKAVVRVTNKENTVEALSFVNGTAQTTTGKFDLNAENGLKIEVLVYIDGNAQDVTSEKATATAVSGTIGFKIAANGIATN